MPSALLKPIYKNTIRFVGDAGGPPEILRRRKWTMETMRRLGTPVLLKHMYNIEDVRNGIAALSPNYDTTQKQARHDDPFSYGVGYCSTETAKEEWIVPQTERTKAELRIGPKESEDWEHAPLYRGYGPGYLTYVILPDAPEDRFKLTDEGAFIKTQQARIQFPWFPVIADNDLMIVVKIDATEHIIETDERYQLKQVNPTTMRTKDRWGRREPGVDLTASGNRHIVGQYCEANKVPLTDPIYEVETDR